MQQKKKRLVSFVSLSELGGGQIISEKVTEKVLYLTDLLSPAVAVAVLVAPLLPAAPLPLPHAPPQPQMMTVVLMVAVVAMVVVGGRAPALLVEGASVSRRRRG